ncbi:NUP85 [Cordylochernes scorpioides]|uniref:Nuclear pore complex protein Nup85 n=1 Tax=Cordylochernes scorpioides TaxID=51811 RepID=A0ABY6LF39_9ARAC|nr:NUP85 [Cordylochernes scorpioides]
MPPGGHLLIKLIEWIQHHFDSVQNQISELYQYENPTEHQSYWEVVTTCILQGNISQARKLLKLHPNSSQDAFLCLEELLNKMPFYSSSSTISLPEFGLRWHHWQSECESCLEDGIFLCFRNLQDICELLCGKKEAFIKNKGLCQTWYHLLVSLAFYTNPCVKAIELQYKAKECIDIFGGDANMSRYDYILLAAMEFNLEDVIHRSCELDDAWWFATHFTDLVYKKGNVKERIASSLHEYILVNYAGVLMSHCSLWQVGLEYLRFCPTLGKAHLETYIERIPIVTEAKAFKLMSIANRNNLPHVAQSIAKAMGMRALKHSMLESAVSWAIRSEDTKLTSYLADRLLDQYCEKNDISCLELLDNMGPCYLLNEKLAFLAKYREFYQLYKNEKYKEAALILVSLISMKLAPKKFWPTLFLHSIPLLEWVEPVLSNSQTFQLLAALEELLACQPPVLTLADIERRLDINLFRLALTRNIARTFISEAEVPYGSSRCPHWKLVSGHRGEKWEVHAGVAVHAQPVTLTVHALPTVHVTRAHSISSAHHSIGGSIHSRGHSITVQSSGHTISIHYLIDLTYTVAITYPFKTNSNLVKSLPSNQIWARTFDHKKFHCDTSFVYFYIEDIATAVTEMHGTSEALHWTLQQHQTKKRIVEALVFPMVTYGFESWTLSQKRRKRIEAFEMWTWRKATQSAMDK